MDPYVAELHVSKDELAPKTSTVTAVQRFYAGQNVFITGGTGFLGKCLIEKLLWSCPDIGNIYMLMREKRGKDSSTRLNELFNTSAFTRLKENIGGFKEKIKIICGDCAMIGLGISTQDRAELIREVNIVFHSAATVRFDEDMNIALNTNVRATQEIVELCREMQSLKALVHVSTAYSHCYNLNMGEHFYETPMDPLKLLKFVETADQQIIDAISPKLLGKWPNTYSFSKAMAEDYLRQEGVGLPLGIFRPSIVISSVREPLPKWVDSWYGLNGYVTACGAGLLRALRVGGGYEANVVPVDYVVNGLIASAWDVSTRFEDMKGVANARPSSRDIRIYNYTLTDNPIKWTDLYHWACEGGENVPPLKTLWYRCIVMTKNKYLHMFNRLFLHFIPAMLFDLMAVCSGNKPQIFNMYKRIDKMEDVTIYFTTREWVFANHNTQKLIAKMSDEDSKLYPCDLKQIKWREYMLSYYLGVRRYLLKDDDSTLPAARKKYKRLYYLHRVMQLIVFILVLRGTYNAGKVVFSYLDYLSKIPLMALKK